MFVYTHYVWWCHIFVCVFLDGCQRSTAEYWCNICLCLCLCLYVDLSVRIWYKQQLFYLTFQLHWFISVYVYVGVNCTKTLLDRVRTMSKHSFTDSIASYFFCVYFLSFIVCCCCCSLSIGTCMHEIHYRYLTSSSEIFFVWYLHSVSCTLLLV